MNFDMNNWTQKVLSLRNEMDRRICELVEKYGKLDRNQIRLYVDDDVKLEGARIDYITIIKQGSAKITEIHYQDDNWTDYLDELNVAVVADCLDRLEEFVSSDRPEKISPEDIG